MRFIGVIFAVVGIVWGIVAFNMPTTVETGGDSVGSLYVPRQEVHNLDLAEKRRTHLLISGLLIVVGSVLFGFDSVRNSSGAESTAGTRKCPFCAELVKGEAKICKHCGKDLPAFEPESVVKGANSQPTYNDNGQLVIRICSSCRATNNGSTNECSRCGAILPA